MNRLARRLPLAALTLALFVGLAPGRQPPAGPGQDILDIAKKIEAGKDAQADMQAAQKKWGLDEVMDLYKPRNKGGLGFGPKGDGIDQKLNRLARRALSPEDLGKEKDDLIKLAYQSIAITELSKHYPVKPRGGKGKKEWDEFAEDTRKGTLELIQAAKAGDAGKVKSAAGKVTNGCLDCHNAFR